MVKPFLKWLGGKQKLLSEIYAEMPQDGFVSYHEPFLGGGSVMLGLLSSGNVEGKQIFASDINQTLIGLYINI